MLKKFNIDFIKKNKKEKNRLKIFVSFNNFGIKSISKKSDDY